MRGGPAQVVLALAVALAAVPAAGAGPSARSAWSACSLITKPEAAAALGTSLKSVTAKSSATGALICNWIGAGTTVPVKAITVTAATSYGKQRYLARRALASAPTAVKGLGTAAFLDSGGRDLVLYSGSDYLEVAAPTVSTAKLLKLARLALARLKTH